MRTEFWNQWSFLYSIDPTADEERFEMHELLLRLLQVVVQKLMLLFSMLLVLRHYCRNRFQRKPSKTQPIQKYNELVPICLEVQ